MGYSSIIIITYSPIFPLSYNTPTNHMIRRNKTNMKFLTLCFSAGALVIENFNNKRMLLDCLSVYHENSNMNV